MNIIFAGTPEFAAIALKAITLNSDFVVKAVLTQPDRKAGRGRKTVASPVKKVAEENNITVLQPESLRPVSVIDSLRKFDADVMVVAAYGLMVPSEVLSLPRFGCINIHASLLPRWRGAAPIQRAIQAGDRQSGITIMQMDEGLDTGAMILQVPCSIGEHETGGSLHDKLAGLGTDALMQALSLLGTSLLSLTVQDEQLSCYASKLSKKEALIDWNESALSLERKVRAFNPWPIAFTYLGEGKQLRVGAAEVISSASELAPGTMIGVSKQGIEIVTGDGVLRLTQVQLSGRKMVAARDFINAYELKLGTRLADG